jgi:hypothetical protein
MAKIHKNAEKFPITWDGTVVGGEAEGDNIPSSETVVWGSNPFTWGDVQFIQDIVDGIGTGSRRERQDRLDKLDKDKKKRLIRLICRIKGEKVYDDTTEVGNVKINIDDVELVSENIIGKIKLEIKSGL